MKQWLLALLFGMWLLGLFTEAHYFLSIPMIALVFLCFFSISFRPFKIGARGDVLENISLFLRRPDWWGTCLFFGVVLVSALWSTQDTPYLLERLRIKLPFLVLPLAFFALPEANRKDIIAFYYAFILGTLLAAAYSCLLFAIDYENVLKSIYTGAHLPTANNPVRFSLMVAYAIFLCVYFFHKQIFIKNASEKWVLLAAGALLIIYLHILAVRSGLATFYALSLLMLLIYVFKHKNYLQGALALLAGAAFMVLFYLASPSLQRKIDYMRYDWSRYKDAQDMGYSDAARWVSMSIGLEIGNEHPLFGVGAGDLQQAVKEKHAHYNIVIPEKQYLMPHNQWVSAYAATGIVGLLATAFAFFAPLFYGKNYQHPLVLSLGCITFLSFLVENTLENALGAAFYLLFLLFALKYKKWI